MTKFWILGLALGGLSLTLHAEPYPAVLDWSQRTTLSTPVSGVVKTRPVVPGDRVSAGQVLLTLDERPFESRLRDATAQAHKEKLRRDEAKRELERTQSLYERTVISVHDLQLQEIATASAEADYASAQARLDAARLALEYSRLRAPYGGRVLATPVQVGETVVNRERATPMMVLGQDHPMVAQANLDLDQAAGLSNGQPARVQVGGRRYDGRIIAITAEPGEPARYYVRIVFESDQETLRAGQDARVEFKR